uniref:methyltransferase domain-containing protein n=1 Tax=Selenomonas sp. TAMA-11512 TaxID=3095337 RepID=UPI00403F2C8B
MRDLGYPFEWYDKFCANLFAKHHEKTRSHYDVVTAFGLFEHLSQPETENADIMELGNIIITTTLIDDDSPHVDDWWYYVPLHGQHISHFMRENPCRCWQRHTTVIM